MQLNNFKDDIIECLRNKMPINDINELLINKYGEIRGISKRSIRRFIKQENLLNRCDNTELQSAVSNAINQVGPYYGRRMIQGTLRSIGVNACQGRIREAMMTVDPHNHQLRVIDGQRRFNPVPYNSQYFGHKLHIDLNEKLVDFGSVLIGAIDGYSGLLVSCFTTPQKNCLDVYRMYRDLLLQYGIWDQIRVDRGREFFLMLKIQEDLQHLRFNTSRLPYVQSTSRMNRIIERIWHEVNQRVNYRIKSNLVELNNMNLLDMDLQIDKVCVGHVVRSLVQIGLDVFQSSWNHHHIPKKGIPSHNASENCKIIPLHDDLVPSVDAALRGYDEIGTINTNYDHIKPFGQNEEANLRLSQLFSQESYKFSDIYQQIMHDSFNLEILHNIIQEHRSHFITIDELLNV